MATLHQYDGKVSEEKSIFARSSDFAALSMEDRAMHAFRFYQEE